MPGLLRAVAATAVISGTATATRNAVNRKQATKNTRAYTEAAQTVSAEQAPQYAPPPPPRPAPPPPPQYAPPPPPPPPAPKEDIYDQLERLGELHADGILTDEEFAAKKAQLLGL